MLRPMTWIALLTVAAGGLLTLLGLRGRRADDHPLCRRCGFDLTGNPAAPVCTECGVDLTRPKAIKVGRRARRRLPLAVGGTLLLLALVAGGVGGWRWARGVDWQQHKPEWWLRHDLASGDFPRSAAAFGEIARRRAAKTLSPDAALSAADWVLRQQADSSRKWDYGWGKFVQTLRDEGALDDARYGRFAVGSVAPTLTTRRRVGRGDPVPLQINPGTRGAPGAAWSAVYEWESAEFAGRDVPLVKGRAVGSMQVSQRGSSTQSAGPFIGGERTKDLPSGAARATGTIRLRVAEGFNSLDGMMKQLTRPAVGEGVVSVSADTDVRPAGEDLGLTFADESMRAGVGRSVTIEAPEPVTAERETYRVRVYQHGSPARTMFRLSVRDGGREAAAKHGYLSGQTNGSSSGSCDLDGEAAALLREAADAGRPVDVLLRADVEGAKNLVEMSPIWEGEVVIPRVPVAAAPGAAGVYGSSRGVTWGVGGPSGASR